MKTIPVLLLALLAASCSSSSQQTTPPANAPTGVGTQITLTEADRAQVQTAVRTQIANQQATFRTMIGQRDASGVVTVCGYFNGGSGDTPFVGALGGGAFTVSDLGGPTERTIAVQKACHGRGIYI